MKHSQKEYALKTDISHTSVPYCNSPQTFVVGWVYAGIPLTPDQSRVSSKVPTARKHWSTAREIHMNSKKTYINGILRAYMLSLH